MAFVQQLLRTVVVHPRVQRGGGLGFPQPRRLRDGTQRRERARPGLEQVGGALVQQLRELAVLHQPRTAASTSARRAARRGLDDAVGAAVPRLCRCALVVDAVPQVDHEPQHAAHAGSERRLIAPLQRRHDGHQLAIHGRGVGVGVGVGAGGGVGVGVGGGGRRTRLVDGREVVQSRRRHVQRRLVSERVHRHQRSADHLYRRRHAVLVRRVERRAVRSGLQRRLQLVDGGLDGDRDLGSMGSIHDGRQLRLSIADDREVRHGGGNTRRPLLGSVYHRLALRHCWWHGRLHTVVATVRVRR